MTKQFAKYCLNNFYNDDYDYEIFNVAFKEDWIEINSIYENNNPFVFLLSYELYNKYRNEYLTNKINKIKNIIYGKTF